MTFSGGGRDTDGEEMTEGRRNMKKGDRRHDDPHTGAKMAIVDCCIFFQGQG